MSKNLLYGMLVFLIAYLALTATFWLAQLLWLMAGILWTRNWYVEMGRDDK